MSYEEIERLADMAIEKKLGCLKVNGVEIYPTSASFTAEVQFPDPTPAEMHQAESDARRKRPHVLVNGRRIPREVVLRSGRPD